ncbi:beta strand repeat-containing protein, partial [Echinicola jeungdonensis]
MKRSNTFYSFLFSFFLIGLLGLQEGIAQNISVIAPNGGFEIDGNIEADSPTFGVGDWINGSGPGGFVFHDNGNPFNGARSKLIKDSFDSSTDEIFSSGTKALDNPNTWTWTNSKASSKADINNFFYHIATDSNNDDWLFVGSDRFTTNGQSYIDIEFFQESVIKNPDGTFTSNGTDAGRTVNDVMITVGYSNGGSNPIIEFYTWQNLGGGNYGYVQGSFLPNQSAGQTNSGTFNVPFGAFYTNEYTQNQFVEVAVNVSKIVAEINPCLGVSIKTMIAKTKSSISETAAANDFVNPVQVAINFGTATISYDKIDFCYGNNFAPVTLNGVSGGVFSANMAGLEIDPSTGEIDVANSIPGDYSVIYSFTTEGCNKSVTYDVTIPEAIDLQETIVDVSCEGGSTGEIALNVSGGTPSYTYSWTGPNGFTSSSEDISGLEAGEYTVSITDANGCTTSETFNVEDGDGTAPTIDTFPSDPQVKTIPAGQTSYTASGGEFDIAASDNSGTVNLSYTLDGGASVTAPSLDGVAFGLGDTQVIWTAADDCGNAVTYSFTVTVYAPDISITKSVDAASISAPGVLNYTITLVNEGNQDLTGVTVTDLMPNSGSEVTLSNPTGDDNSDGIFDVGETWIYTAIYSATQADIDAGSDLVNEAFVNTDQTTEISDTATTTITQSPSFTVTKEVDVDNISSPSTLSYTIVITNTGNTSLTNVSPTDVLPDGSAGTLTGPTESFNTDGVLEVGEDWTYTVGYDATQEDIDAGLDLINTVTVSADELGSPVSDDATTTITQNPGFTVNKVVDVDNISSPTTLFYTIEIENTGNTSLTNVSPLDVLPDGSTATLTGPSESVNTNGALDVGEKWTYSASYDATQTDIDAGSDLINTVSVSVDEIGSPESDEATTTISQNAGIEITKVVDETSISSPATLTYDIEVTNTGNVSLTNVVVTDPFVNGGTALSLASGDIDGDNELDIAEIWSYTISYNVSQAEIDAGSDLINEAFVNTTETIETSDIATTTISQTPSFTVDKTVNPGNISGPATLNYTIVITNTGNVSLNNVNPSDVMPDGSGGTLTGPTESANSDGVLEVAENWTYTASYGATQEDIDAGSDLTNTVTVSVDELGSPVSDDAKTTISQNPGIAITKAVDKTGISVPNTLNYTIEVINTGNVSLTNVIVTDPFTNGGTALTLDSGDTDGDGELDTNETWFYITSYDADQADIDAGADLVNEAFVNTDQTTEISDDATTTISQSPQIDLDKTASKTSSIQVGDVITYNYVVTNTGNITVNNIDVTDVHPGEGNLGSITPSGSTTIAPGETVTFTATYTVLQEDIDNGVSITNIATATGTGTDGSNLSVQDDETITPESELPNISLIKEGTYIDSNGDGVANVGDEITYSFTIENSGNVTLHGIRVTDPQVTVSGSAITLAPGATDNSTFTAVYALTQADIDAGTFTNTAEVNGVTPGDAPVTDND